MEPYSSAEVPKDIEPIATSNSSKELEPYSSAEVPKDIEPIATPSSSKDFS